MSRGPVSCRLRGHRRPEEGLRWASSRWCSVGWHCVVTPSPQWRGCRHCDAQWHRPTGKGRWWREPAKAGTVAYAVEWDYDPDTWEPTRRPVITRAERSARISGELLWHIEEGRADGSVERVGGRAFLTLGQPGLGVGVVRYEVMGQDLAMNTYVLRRVRPRWVWWR